MPARVRFGGGRGGMTRRNCDGVGEERRPRSGGGAPAVLRGPRAVSGVGRRARRDGGPFRPQARREPGGHREPLTPRPDPRWTRLMPWSWTPERRDEPELMDAPGLPEAEVVVAYRALRRVHRHTSNP